MTRARLTPDMALRVGMRLADADGNAVTVEAVTVRVVLVTGSFGGHSHAFVRARWPFIVA